MKTSNDEIIAASFSQFGIVAEDAEILAFAKWIVKQETDTDLVTFEQGTIEERTHRLISDAAKDGKVVTITLYPTKPLRMGGYEMRAEFRPLPKAR